MEECCSESGCGCNATTMYTDRECPDCGRKLRMTGNLRTIQLFLICPECGYRSSELSLDELSAII